MDIAPYVERLRHDLAQAAATGDDTLREAGERLSLAVDPAMRLALMEALSQAAAEITTEMRGGAVELRLAGRELDFVVSHPAPTPSQAVHDEVTAEEEGEEAATARITLRLPESVKARAEELAAKGGQSLNTWIVSVLRAATRDRAVTVDIDLSSVPFLEGDFPFGRGRGRGGKRMTGWV